MPFLATKYEIQQDHPIGCDSTFSLIPRSPILFSNPTPQSLFLCLIVGCRARVCTPPLGNSVVRRSSDGQTIVGQLVATATIDLRAAPHPIIPNLSKHSNTLNRNSVGRAQLPARLRYPKHRSETTGQIKRIMIKEIQCKLLVIGVFFSAAKGRLHGRPAIQVFTAARKFSLATQTRGNYFTGLANATLAIADSGLIVFRS